MKFKNNLFGLRIKGVKTYRHSPTNRLLHGVLVPSFFVLALSGFYIHKPVRNRVFDNMDSARKAHFIAQYFFGYYFLLRGYHAVVKNGYRKLFPAKEDIASLPKFMSYQFFIKNKKPKYPKYNPGQKLLFLAMALLFPLQIISGMTLYSTRRLQVLSRLFGGLNSARMAHYINAVGLSAMIAGHIYFALTDSLGKLKSIVVGYFKPE